jgi:myo-inositol-1(or 4)-monophosphatase
LPALDDLALLTQAAKRAGEIACPYWCADPKTWDKGGGAGPVTEADLAVDEMLAEFLRGARPSYGWLSEETQDTDERLTRERTFIVDPIDGTRSFIAGDRNWSHSIAIAQRGEVVAAVVYLPLRERMFLAQKGKGATLNGVPLQVGQTQNVDGASLLTAKVNLNTEHWQDAPPAFVHKARPSLAYRMALVAQARYDAMLTLRNTWEWDVAAGTLLVHEAGGCVTDRFGTAPIFNKPTPAFDGLVASNPTLHQGIRERLKP